jgi:beta-phosphoglucomutase-like phosphatase (HAD superfamily)
LPALIFDYDGLIADTEALVGTVLVDLLAARGVATGVVTPSEPDGRSPSAPARPARFSSAISRTSACSTASTRS